MAEMQQDETLRLDQDLDRLEQECSKLLSLLRDRHIGLSTWRFIVGQRAVAVNEILKELGMVKE